MGGLLGGFLGPESYRNEYDYQRALMEVARQNNAQMGQWVNSSTSGTSGAGKKAEDDNPVLLLLK